MDSLLLFTAMLLVCAGGTMSSKCPKCGPTSVPYPLSTGPTCGDQRYKIRCDAGTLKFDTVNNTYPIRSISPKNQRLVIEPAAILPGTCVSADLVHRGVQLNSSLPFNITSANSIVYLNCTADLLRSPLDCSAASPCHVYADDGAGPCEDAGAVCCYFRTGGSATSYGLRVREEGCSAYASFVNLDPELQVNRWPEPGLEIEWARPKKSS